MGVKDSLSVVIVDDEPASCETLVGLLDLIGVSHEVLGIANTKENAVELITRHCPDMVFLDVELMTCTGFDVIKELGGKCPEVVFTTAHDQYAVDAFRVGASDFLLKPVVIDHLEEAVNRVRERISTKSTTTTLPEHIVPDRIAIRSVKSVDYVVPANISHIEVEGSYCTVYVVDGRSLVATTSLKEYETLLGENAFCRISHSVLLNLDQIKGYKRFNDKCFVVLYNGEQMLVSRRRRSKLLDALDARFGGTS